jgi:hypothetical protein
VAIDRHRLLLSSALGALTRPPQIVDVSHLGELSRRR